MALYTKDKNYHHESSDMSKKTLPRIMTPIIVDGKTVCYRDDTPLNDYEKLVQQFKIERKNVEHFISDKKRSKYNNWFQKLWAKLFGISGKFLFGDTKTCIIEKIKWCNKKKCNKKKCKIFMLKNGNIRCRYLI